MGFNNGGAARRLAESVWRGRVWVPPRGLDRRQYRQEQRHRSRERRRRLSECVSTLVYDVADYVTVNVSSPNTAGLRDLQRKRLAALAADGAEEAPARTARRTRPIRAVSGESSRRISTTHQTDAIAQVLLDVGIDGCIATNTTIARPMPDDVDHRDEAGGLSGDRCTTRVGVRRATRALARWPHSDHRRRRHSRRRERAPLHRRRRVAGAGVHRLHLRRPRPGASSLARAARRLANCSTTCYAFGRVGDRIGPISFLGMLTYKNFS